jgi:DNA-binding HxlR family transcriptional regulator
MGTVGECGCSSQIALALEEPVCFCPTTGIIQMIGRRYSLALLGTIGNTGRVRFSELKEQLGRISPSTLAVRLEELEVAGLIRREVYAEVPPRVEYSLTRAGEELRERLKALLARRAPSGLQG